MLDVAAVRPGMPTYRDPRPYRDWVAAYTTAGPADRRAIREMIRQLPRIPMFSLVMLPGPSGDHGIEDAVASVLGQLYPHWELWLPGDPAVADDRRVRRIAPHATAPDRFNAALAQAEGTFVLPLLPDALLHEAALYELAAAVSDDPNVDLLYTDEDQLTEAGERCCPRFKTGWDPDLALGRDAIGLLAAYRKACLDRLGGMRSASLWELSLRVAEATLPTQIRHVPSVLCHRRSAVPDENPAATRTMIAQYLAGQGVADVGVVPAPLAPGWNRVVRPLPATAPRVSIIMPTRDRADLLARAADAVLRRTDYPDLELLVVDNDSTEPAAQDVLARLARDPQVRVLPYPQPFNFAAQNNLAAREATGEVLVLLNNDIDCFDPGWLRELVSHAVRPDVGAAGAKLLYPDGRVQHGGMVLGPGVWPTHQLRFADRNDAGPDGELALVRSVSVVTGACLAVRRVVYQELGGLNEAFRVVFNDVDFCLRLGDHGYRIVWTPFAELLHFESATRGNDDATPETLARATGEALYFRRFWRALLETDPFYNPNIVYGWDTSALAAPPRCQRPW